MPDISLIASFLAGTEAPPAPDGFFAWFLDLFLRLDQHLADVVARYHEWTYLILFVIVFCETGLVVTPILPGDSLLFAAGAVAATADMNPWLLVITLAAAAILGDTVNYHIGKFLGPKVLTRPDSRIFKKQYLDRTHRFYEKYGGMTIILARFVPIIRTFAPFVAGVGAMSYRRFIAFNIIGGVAWVLLGVFSGYLFGNIPFVKDRFSLILIAIVILSILPMAVELIRHRRAQPAQETST